MPDYANRLEIATRLKDQLDRAYASHLAARARFDLLLKDSPSGLPHPDGSLQIERAGNQAREALQQYTLALNQFTEFTTSWQVPKNTPSE